MRRKKGARVLGPLRHPSGWRVITFFENGKRVDRLVATEQEALQVIAEVEKALELEGPITVKEALEKYEAYLGSKGNKPVSVDTTLFRLQGLLGKGSDGHLARIDPGHLYSKVSSSHSADYARNSLSEAKTFGRYCVKQGWVRRNPWEGIEPQGKRKKGKPQLRVDEARRWLAKAQELASKGDEGAVAAMMTLLLGLRASEVVERVWRDLDDNGTLLWIDASKTEAGKRVVEVPRMLSSLVASLRETRQGNQLGRNSEVEPIFPHDRHWVREQVKRICVLSKVPVIGAHGMRGTHASLSMAAGASSQLVASSLGQSGPDVMLAHYATRSSVDAGRTGKALKVLAGGKK